MAGHLGVARYTIPRVEWCPERATDTERVDPSTSLRVDPENGRGIEGRLLRMLYVYILRCVDGSFYVGMARNLYVRVKAHNAGRGAAYTFKRRPVRLVYSETFISEAEAIQRERQLKAWSRAKKEAVVAGDLHSLKRLSKRRS